MESLLDFRLAPHVQYSLRPIRFGYIERLMETVLIKERVSWPGLGGGGGGGG
jgi:hypothetical protein